MCEIQSIKLSFSSLNLINRANKIHGYNTKANNNIHLVRTSIGAHSTLQNAMKLYNNIPDRLKNLNSIEKFKNY